MRFPNNLYLAPEKLSRVLAEVFPMCVFGFLFLLVRMLFGVPYCFQ